MGIPFCGSDAICYGHHGGIFNVCVCVRARMETAGSTTSLPPYTHLSLTSFSTASVFQPYPACFSTSVSPSYTVKNLVRR